MSAEAYVVELLPRLLDRLRDHMRIAVIYAGDAGRPGAVLQRTHNPRPWKSYEPVAEDIAEALRTLGFRHVLVLPDDLGLPERLREEAIDLVWLNTGGVQGYDPLCHTPALCEMMGLPYVGHRPLHAAELDDKWAFKRALAALGLPVARGIHWRPSAETPNPVDEPAFRTVFGSYEGPFVVKPVSGRASLNVHYVETLGEVSLTAWRIFSQTHHEILIEEYLSGREFCVAVSGSIYVKNGSLFRNDGPLAFSILERKLEPGERIFASMDRRAITADRVRFPEEPPLRESLRRLAARVYHGLGLQALVRIDLRADAEGVLQVLEANPKPDLKRPTEERASLVALGLRENGMRYEDLVLGLLADRLDSLLTGGICHAPVILQALEEVR